jgi:hypothetical protein
MSSARTVLRLNDNMTLDHNNNDNNNNNNNNERLNVVI